MILLYNLSSPEAILFSYRTSDMEKLRAEIPPPFNNLYSKTRYLELFIRKLIFKQSRCLGLLILYYAVLLSKEILVGSPPHSSNTTNRLPLGFSHERGTWYHL